MTYDREWLSSDQLERKLGRAKTISFLNPYRTGSALKQKVRGSGSFVRTKIGTMAELRETLSRFFHGKHHEWFAVAFLDSSYACRLLWLNKGDDRQSVLPSLGPADAVTISKRFKFSHVLIAHNHPVDTSALPYYGSRMEKARAYYAQKEAHLGFSDADLANRTYWHSVLEPDGLGFADMVFVAGWWKVHGDDLLVNQIGSQRDLSWKSYRTESTQRYNGDECFIATCVFGEASWQTEAFRDFRDRYLMRTGLGRALISVYYKTSPPLAEFLRNREKLASWIAKILDPFAAFVSRTFVKESPG